MKFETLKKRKVVAIDTETTGLRIYKDVPFGVSLGWSSGEIWLPLKEQKWVKMKELKAWLEDDKRKTRLVFHNAKFDLHMFHNMGINVAGPIGDTMVLAHCCNEEEESIALKKLAVKYLDPEAGALQDEIRKLRCPYSEVPPVLIEKYAKKDVRLTYDLYQYLMGVSEPYMLDVYNMEMELMPTVLRMEQRGHTIDKEYLRRQKKELERTSSRWHRKLVKMAGRKDFNPNSSKQLAEVVYEKTDPIKYTKTGQPSVDREALSRMPGEFPEAIREYRVAKKMLNTYIDPLLLGPNPVHCRFRQVGTVSGRFSSAEPNLQNIPRIKGGIRGAFIPRPGCRLFYFDYSQVEMTLFAWYSEDPNLLEPLKAGFDIHTETAQALFEKQEVTAEERKLAKSVNFGILYGQGAQGLAISTGWTLQEARRFIIRYNQRFPGVRSLMRDAKLVLARKGYITNAFGRRRHLSREKRYRGVNALIQGCAADLLKRAMILVDAEFDGLILTIHDEVVIEAKELDVDRVVELMTGFSGPSQPLEGCPLKVSVSVTETNWQDKRPYGS